MSIEEKSYIFSRVFKCDGEDLSIDIAVPYRQTDGDYICSYKITTAERTINREASGIDSIQAFIMALMQLGSFLYSGKLIDPLKTFWLSPAEMGYLGLPVPIEDQGRIPSGPKLILAV